MKAKGTERFIFLGEKFSSEEINLQEVTEKGDELWYLNSADGVLLIRNKEYVMYAKPLLSPSWVTESNVRDFVVFTIEGEASERRPIAEIISFKEPLRFPKILADQISVIIAENDIDFKVFVYTSNDGVGVEIKGVPEVILEDISKLLSSHWSNVFRPVSIEYKNQSQVKYYTIFEYNSRWYNEMSQDFIHDYGSPRISIFDDICLFADDSYLGNSCRKIVVSRDEIRFEEPLLMLGDYFETEEDNASSNEIVELLLRDNIYSATKLKNIRITPSFLKITISQGNGDAEYIYDNLNNIYDFQELPKSILRKILLSIKLS